MLTRRMMKALARDFWDKLRGVRGYTLEIETHRGWVPLHPNPDGSPYVCSYEHAQEALKSLVLNEKMNVRVAPVKRRKK